MSSKLVVGPFKKGLQTNVLPFNIDNDAFPVLINAYQWRGRVKRKRGTTLLGRLARFFNSTSTAYTTTSSFNLVAGAGNLITGFNLETNASIVPGSVSITVGANTYTDPALDGVLVGAPGGSGTINYATGAITIAGGGAGAVSGSFRYYPVLPVMGLEDLKLNPTVDPGTIAFDTTYSYNIKTTFPYDNYDVSFYKNIATDVTNYPGYTPKTTWTNTWWNGEDYRQFWTVNYQGALWATNGVNVPFTTANIGMQFKPITNVTNIVAGPPATARLDIANHGLVIGDFLFLNEIQGVTGINFQTCYVIAVPNANQVDVEFSRATLGGAYSSGGIAQYLTNRADTSLDCIRWYDGDPTNGSVTSPAFSQGKGWVNFMPPLSNLAITIADLPPAQYYLAGARMIVPFKDRLLFIGPVVQSSSAGSQVYLQDTIVYSQNGTPYYTASFTGDPTLATTTYTPQLVPLNQTATPNAYWSDLTGYGGFITAGISQPIVVASTNGDVLICEFNTIVTRLVYTSNDIVPFNFYLINSELGAASTFSAINFDQGVMSFGNRGFIISSQTQTQRSDLEIPDQVFEVSLENNGNERVTSIRDFINEWAYFTYVNNNETSEFPNETLLYNYRDHSWGIFHESYTTYGNFSRKTGFTWADVGTIYPTWSAWNDPWNAGQSTLEQPDIIGGNQQGFVLFRDEGTEEGDSLMIQGISTTTITSPDHGLDQGDFIVISGVIGSMGYQVNGRIFEVVLVTQHTFTIDSTDITGTYIGGGLIKRLYNPYIQTKAFPAAWEIGRKTRIGPQRYLLTTTNNSRIQLLIFLSENTSNPYNEGPIVPDTSSLNNSLIYNTVLYTCPESTNLGLTPANINLMTPTAIQQDQIWHRINTSLIGDTIQLGFTMSEEQMKELAPIGTAIDITDATQTNPCVLTTTANYPAGTLILITDVEGMVQLNGNVYYVISSTATDVTISVDATGFDAYTDGGTTIALGLGNQIAEIELHGFIIDISQSQALV